MELLLMALVGYFILAVLGAVLGFSWGHIERWLDKHGLWMEKGERK